jgi:mannose-6-phosphate isomerase
MLTPIVLAPNQPPRFYRGGAGIARFRGTPQPDDHRPEDFIGSTTEVASGGGVGLSQDGAGATLRDLIEADPAGYLGAEHVASYGTDVGVLVKMLDTGERLLVHFHPSRDFARDHLNCAHGKSESWYIVDVAEETGYVYLGFTDDVAEATVDAWMAGQRSADMLAAMNKIAIRPGDTFFVPGGIPHAIGAGITLIELQEPVDFSITLEWDGYDIDGPKEGHLGLGFDVALLALDRSAWPAERIAALRERRPAESPGVTPLFPSVADEFFRAQHLTITEPVTFPAEFSILVVLGGSGELEAGGQTVPLSRGTAVLVPYGAGESRITGTVDALRCLPPAPRKG